MKRNTHARKTGAKSRLLENCVNALTLINFVVFDGAADFAKANGSQRYVIRNYPHDSLYGTRGKKEAFIFAPHFAAVVECKYQDVSGSVDEKLPYIYEAFCASPIANWIVVLDGKYWKSARGKAAVLWLKEKASPEGKTLHVVDGKGFASLARTVWGRS